MGRKRAYSILEAEQARERGQFSRLLLMYAVQLEDDDGGEDDGDETACVLLAAADSYGQSREPFLRQMPRFQVGPRRFSFNRIVEEWGETTRNCKDAFRFTLPQLRQLIVHWRVPAEFTVGPPRSQRKFTGEEGVLVLLHRFRRPISWNDMAWLGGRQ